MLGLDEDLVEAVGSNQYVDPCGPEQGEVVRLNVDDWSSGLVDGRLVSIPAIGEGIGLSPAFRTRATASAISAVTRMASGSSRKPP
ncbi:hypothetical protein N0B44_21085 [Roseibacterium beibuensis]|uniref:hypothetical protein n=1 Tax=[Roseibacterium] beibuensis TaxID=1193142 RepID=UPI00217DB41D|nr:hypothetical protein [Roseibacterium beibuensis]MCS6625410.1 hypothetical protein [Roseibacterium beibuensis]